MDTAKCKNCKYCRRYYMGETKIVSTCYWTLRNCEDVKQTDCNHIKKED